MPAKVMRLDLAEPERALAAPGYSRASIVVQWRGLCLGTVVVPVENNYISLASLSETVQQALGERVVRPPLREWLGESAVKNESEASVPVSIVICTRNRTDDLNRCLNSLLAMQPPAEEIVVVDNAPSDTETRDLCASFPVRYVLEQRPGLNWARTTGARTASQDLVLFTDDDVVVDPGWACAMAKPFSDPAVGGVTGLVLPFELETEAQELFEAYGGFSRGFTRRSFSAATLNPVAVSRVGAGASMGFRRGLLRSLRLFETEMDCGTPTRSGGDHYAFYRLMCAGHTIVYEPAALSSHRHRRTMEELRSTFHGYGVGAGCYLLRCFLRHGETSALFSALSWAVKDHVLKLARALAGRPSVLPPNLVWAELCGLASSPFAYLRAMKRERALEAKAV